MSKQHISGETVRTFAACHYENTPIQIYRKIYLQKLKKKLWYFS